MFHTPRRPPSLYGRYFVLFVIALFGLAAPTAAQDTPPTPTPPVRNAEREAPPREPVVLESGRSAEGVRTVIQLPAVADTYIASERPFDNFGSDSLFLGFNLAEYGAQRILIRFDLSAIPAGARINSAQLRLFLTFSSPTEDAPMGTVLRRVASPWNEFAVTWNTEPTWTPIDDVTYVGDTPGEYIWEVGDVVDAWVNVDPAENYGLEIIGAEAEQQRERAFYSRETTTNFFPTLTVDYTEGGDFDDDLPPVVTVDALPAFAGRSFTVTWSGEDQGEAGIDFYDVQYRVLADEDDDEEEWIDWQEETEETTAEFNEGENGRIVQFRARGVDNAGNVEPFGDVEAETIVDSRPPAAAVIPLPAVIGVDTFGVNWQGDDAGGSGIQYFDVQYRVNGGPWILWQSQTNATSATFEADQDGIYAFEARAVDNTNRVELFTNEPEATAAVDTQPPFITPRAWLPFVTTQPEA